MKIKATAFSVSFIAVLLFMSARFIFYSPAAQDTVMGISHSLACPCECPMVLEDCHMSCGLEWKDMIGDHLKAGITKPSIVAYFYKRYGTEALLTPAQRFAGKWYQVSRGGYPVKDMTLFGLIVIVWTVLAYSLIMMLLEKYLVKNKTA